MSQTHAKSNDSGNGGSITERTQDTTPEPGGSKIEATSSSTDIGSQNVATQNEASAVVQSLSGENRPKNQQGSDGIADNRQTIIARGRMVNSSSHEDTSVLEIQCVPNENAFYKQEDLENAIKKAGATNVVVQNTVVANYAQIGTNSTINFGTRENKDSLNSRGRRKVCLSERMQNLLETTRMVLSQNLDMDVICPPVTALRLSKDSLSKSGHVMITGRSGHGKTTLGLQLMSESERRPVIIKDVDDLKDLQYDEDQIIMIDDIFGKHGYDATLKRDWTRQFLHLVSMVKCGDVQLIITSRIDIIEMCRTEIENYIFFKRDNIIDLSDSEMGMTTEEKELLLEKYLLSKYAAAKITICDNDEPAHAINECESLHRISRQNIKEIAKFETYLGFPQCAMIFVSDLKCFLRGPDFFRCPSEYIRKDMDKLRDNDNDSDLFQYCTLVVVLLRGRLTMRDLSGDEANFKIIADACRVPTLKPLNSNLRRMAQLMTSTYLNFSKTDGSYTFKHNSLLEAVFMSVFESNPSLVLQYCEFDVIRNIVTIEPPLGSSRVCVAPVHCYRDLIRRLENELLKGNIKSVISYNAMHTPEFVRKFCLHIKQTGKVTDILTVKDSSPFQSAMSPIMCWTAYTANIVLIENLLNVSKPEERAKCIPSALKTACSNGQENVFEYLTDKHDFFCEDEFLISASAAGNVEILKGLLVRHKYSNQTLMRAIDEACRWGRYNTYQELILLPGMVISHEWVHLAIMSQSEDILDDILKKHIVMGTEPLMKHLYNVCPLGNFQLYYLLITLPGMNPRLIGLGLLQMSAVSTNVKILQDILERRVWVTSHICDALLCSVEHGNIGTYDILVCHPLAKIRDNLLPVAVQSGCQVIVTDLLSRHTFTNQTMEMSVTLACEKGLLNIYLKLIRQDMPVCSKWLPSAAASGNKEIVLDLLSRFVYDSSSIGIALGQACAFGQYKVYKELVSKIDTHLTAELIGLAAKSGDLAMVEDLLNRQCWQADVLASSLSEACTRGRFDLYSVIMSRMTNVTMADEFLVTTASRGCKMILKDMLERQSWGEESVKKSLHSACNTGNYEIFKELIRLSTFELEDDLIQKAVEKNSTEIVRDLLKFRWGETVLNEAMKVACKLGRFDIYKELFACAPETVNDDLLAMTARFGNFLIVNDLLQVRNNWGAQSLTTVVRSACMCGRYDIYIQILTKFPNTEIEQNCLRRAVNSGSVDILNDLLKRRKHGRQEVTGAVGEAIIRGRHDMYLILMSQHSVDVTGNWIIAATATGNIDIVQELLKNFKFEDWLLSAAVEKACEKNSYDIYSLLIKQSDLVVEDRWLVKAAWSNSEHIVTDLLKRYRPKSVDFRKDIVYKMSDLC